MSIISTTTKNSWKRKVTFYPAARKGQPPKVWARSFSTERAGTTFTSGCPVPGAWEGAEHRVWTSTLCLPRKVPWTSKRANHKKFRKWPCRKSGRQSQDNEQGVQVWVVIVEEGRILVGTKLAGTVAVMPTSPEGALWSVNLPWQGGTCLCPSY